MQNLDWSGNWRKIGGLGGEGKRAVYSEREERKTELEAERRDNDRGAANAKEKENKREECLAGDIR